MNAARLEEARDLGVKLFRVVRRMEQDFEAVAASLGLTPLQARTLLSLEEPIPMRDLASGMSCDASNVTGLADRLERLGLIERVPGADRRVKLLSLTEQGMSLRAELADRVAADSSLSARLVKAERAQLDALLDKLLAD
ncbi:DNA-binding transcriptional regulator, MarR family [Actinokineospora alba]|uniref:DNA-binding transcriptional regulator, MarR family n=1 Tax=Actinokineospora alba TaxID=504798 RepID=A0A1H0G5A9_9PSEU|nr:MarR family transcriptional regulator [Actinokineospora alba]TDP69770.1 DNA-binding MarR family transcriptional regulator [Actinokineospora alba]SDI09133.1 DNA-binding transcriptional regulator, MarR family [Actinokineospora alba]SDO02103.1 DNA-binding transcriptional regulator, MarR family [Actinokineospora alba]